MRVPRSIRHKKIKSRQRRIIVGLTSLLSIATVGAANLPLPTFGLATSKDGISINSFSSLPLFPTTIEAFTLSAKEAADFAQMELDAVLQLSQELSMSPTAFYIVNQLDLEIQDTEIKAFDDGAIQLVESQIMLLNQQLIDIENHLLTAKLNEEKAWEVVYELNSYLQSYANNMRLILLLEPAILAAEDSAQQATDAVNQINMYLIQLQNEIASLTDHYNDMLAATDRQADLEEDESNQEEQQETTEENNNDNAESNDEESTKEEPINGEEVDENPVLIDPIEDEPAIEASVVE